jgi:hypothetical protein
MVKLIRPIALLIPLALQLACAGEVRCPLMAPSIQQTMPKVPDGWQAFDDQTKHALTGMEVTFGHPRDSSGAIYDFATPIKHGRGAKVLRWQLGKVNDPYLVCHYFGTSMTLIRSVAGYTTCELTQEAVGAEFRPASARCF